MTDGTQELLQKGAAIEKLAEEVLTEEQLVIDSDLRRNQNREALRALQKKKIKATENVWFFGADNFVRMDCASAKALLKEHQEILDKEIDATRDRMKHKMVELAALQNDTQLSREMQGFMLNAAKDRSAIGIFERPYKGMG